MTAPTPLTPDDLWSLRAITDMRLAPDGHAIAYVLQTSDRAANETHSAIRLLDVHAGAARQLTSGAARDSSPRWSPDSLSLAFVSNREDETAEVYLLPLAGGEARRLTCTRRGTGEPFWSPDGAWVGFSSEERAGERPLLAAPLSKAERERAAKDAADQPRLITRLQYRWDGEGYREGRSKLFRVWLADGRAEQLTWGDFDDGQAACSPDGRTLAFVSDREPDRDANMTSDLWLLDVQTHALRCLTDASRAIERPTWSPDGARLACFAMPRIRDHSAYNVALLVVEVDGGAACNLLAGSDRSASSSAMRSRSVMLLCYPTSASLPEWLLVGFGSPVAYLQSGWQ